MKKIISVFLAMVLAGMMVMPIWAEEASIYVEGNASDAAGYYYGEDINFLIMNDGNLYKLNVREQSSNLEPITVYLRNQDFIIDDGENALYLKRQTEKAKTEAGDIYYEMHSGLGKTDTVSFSEGKNILVGDYVFEIQYDVVLRQSLAKFFDIESPNVFKIADTVEGMGYDTPEDAVTAYLEGLKNQDYDQMLSTFAIETFCENYSAELNFKRIGMINSSYLTGTTNSPIINDNELIKECNISNRTYSVANSITKQLYIMSYSKHTDNEALGNLLLDLKNISLYGNSKDAELADILADLQDFPDFSSLEILELIPGMYLNSHYLNSNNLGVLDRQLRIYGADAFLSVCALIDVDGTKMAMFFDVIRYDGRWYNYTFLGNLATIMGLNSYSAGLTVFESSYDEFIEENRLAEKDVKELLEELEEACDENNSEILQDALDESGCSSRQELISWYEKEVQQSEHWSSIDPCALYDYTTLTDRFCLNTER